MDRRMDFAQFIFDFVRSYETPQAALESVMHTPAARKQKAAKKALVRAIRKYVYIIEH